MTVPPPTSRRGCLLLLVVAVALEGCAGVASRNPLPEEFASEATVPGGPTARTWGDQASELPLRRELIVQQFESSRKESFFGADHHILSISGGGADGAFGAGFLKGWSESGTRPEMLVVTGISTGALIAPFAFLGSAYDDEVEALYTTISTRDLVTRRFLLTGLLADALTDVDPLRALLRRYVDAAMIEAIAREYERGRRLFIGTTHLDARRPVVWNIGAIAASGEPGSAELIRQVMLASASIPGLFPPVRIHVRVGDEEYDELHVDGAVTRQVFLFPDHVNLREFTEWAGLTGTLNLYILRNGKIHPHWVAVKPSLMPIAMSSISTLLRVHGVGDLYRMYLRAKRDRIAFHLAYIPQDFELEPEEDFDPKYMRALFDTAFELSREGYDWATAPPAISLP